MKTDTKTANKPANQNSAEFDVVAADVAKLIQAGKADDAVALAKELVSEGTLGAPWRRQVLLSNAHEAAGNSVESIEVLEGCELPVQARLRHAELLCHEARFEDAIALVPNETEIETVSKKHAARFHLRRAKVFIQAANFETGKAALKSAFEITCENQNIGFWLELGELSFERDLLNISQEALRKVLMSPDVNSQQIFRALNLFKGLVHQNHTPIDLDEIIANFEQYLFNNADDLRLRLSLAWLVLELTRVEKAQDLLNNTSRARIDAKGWVELAKAHLAVGQTTAAASTAKDALDQGDFKPEQIASIRIVLAECLAIEGKYDEALPLLQDIGTLNDDNKTMRPLIMLLRKLGKAELLDEIMEKLQHSNEKSLPPTLAAGLAAFDLSTAPKLLNAPMSQIIPWKMSGRPEHDWPEWSSRVLWGRNAALLLRKWGLYGGAERRQEIFDLLDPIDDTPIKDALSLGRGAILVGTHMGPMYAVFLTLEEMGLPFAFIGAGGTAAATKASEILLSEHGNLGSVKEMFRHLKNGGLLAFGNDALNSNSVHNMKLAGYDCRVSRLATRLSRNQSIPCIWYHAVWNGERIQIEFKKLPQPELGESTSEWEARWYETYKGFLTAYMSTAAENQSGFSMYTNALSRGNSNWWGG